MSAYAVVVNDCAAPAVLGGPISIRTRDTPIGSRNFLLKFDSLATGLPDRLTPRQMDWLETSGHLYAIDLACKRNEGDLEWSRSIEAWLPVRDPAFWQVQAPSLQSIFTSFTADRLILHFEGDPSPANAPRQGAKPFPNHDCISLLSGGIDSFVGMMELINGGNTPLGLSHIAAPSITSAQEFVEAAVRVWQPEFVRLKLSARKYGPEFPDPEPSQRARSLLFLAAATTVAAAGGSNSVFINENGIMAIHLPMTTARIGSLSTHTASPYILNRMASLASRACGVPITINNVLVASTKPEVAEIAQVAGYEGHFPGTVSCWSIGRTSEHCGTCAPCLIRRISCALHGITDVAYKSDAFEDRSILDNDFACDNLTHLVGLIDDIDRKSDLQLQIDYPELLNGSPTLGLPDAIALHRRWAKQASDVLFSHSVPQAVRV